MVAVLAPNPSRMTPTSRWPRRRRWWAVAASLLCSGALLTGCASDWDTEAINNGADSEVITYGSDAKGVTASLAALLGAEEVTLNEWSPTKKEAGCAAERIVRRVGVERLNALGYAPNDASLKLEFTSAERIAVANILTNCIDFSKGFIGLISSYRKLGLTQSACITDGLRRAGLFSVFATSLLDEAQPDLFAADSNLARGMGEAVAVCLTIDDLPPNAPLPRMPGISQRTPEVEAPVQDDDGDLPLLDPSTFDPAAPTTTSDPIDDVELDGIDPDSPLAPKSPSGA